MCLALALSRMTHSQRWQYKKRWLKCRTLCGISSARLREIIVSDIADIIAVDKDQIKSRMTYEVKSNAGASDLQTLFHRLFLRRIYKECTTGRDAWS